MKPNPGLTDEDYKHILPSRRDPKPVPAPQSPAKDEGKITLETWLILLGFVIFLLLVHFL